MDFVYVGTIVRKYRSGAFFSGRGDIAHFDNAPGSSNLFISVGRDKQQNLCVDPYNHAWALTVGCTDLKHVSVLLIQLSVLVQLHSDRPTMNVLGSKQEEQVVLVDPSEFRPDMQYNPQKATEDFRDFEVHLDDV